jgi:hypothetical protein
VRSGFSPQAILFRLLLGLGVVGLGLYLTGWARAGVADLTDSGAASPGPDLAIQSITITPAYPAPGQPANIEVRIANRGDANASGFTTFLYVDPPGPPQLNTPDTSFVYLFGLNAGKTYVWTYRNYVFDAAGCGHAVYAWVDRDNDVAEDNEANNLLALQVCVGMTPTPTFSPTPTPTATRTATPTSPPCQPDTYEPDNGCATARTITTDGVHQIHNLCPMGDEDWVKFTARANITYTLATTNVAADAETVFALHNRCDTPPLASSAPAFGNAAEMIWEAPAAGDYYLKVSHHRATYGQNTGYELLITAATTCEGGAFENDDSCAAARDIAVGGAAQRRQFCKAGDQDWAKFTALAGATYVISATAAGPDAAPVLSLYNGCAFGPPASQGQQLEWTAPAGGVFYIKAQNHQPNLYGDTIRYDLAVAAVACAPDSFEPDSSPAQAAQALPTGVEQTRDFCPADDMDWVRFPAVQNQLYVIETFELGADADTLLCLYGTNGATQIRCDDDGGGGLASRLRWTAPASGDYYLRVTNQNEGSGGPTSIYRLAISAGEPLDVYEPDNSAGQARTIPTDGAAQRHNFTPAADEDWVRFDAVAGEPYVIQTSNLAGDCDTTLHLVDSDGSTELARNDDYGAGTRSLITYIFSRAGTYYARVHHYRTNRAGHGTAYDLSVTRGIQPPTPSPTPTTLPTPGASPTPPASGVQTLIVTNRERLEALYGATAATNVMNRLALLAADGRVRGLVLRAENDASALTAYTLWNAAPLSTTLTNNAAAAVRNLVLTTLDTNPSVEYIVLVGNDLVIPYRRIPDRTRYPERNYQAFVSGGTTIWAACRDSMSLTDDFYGDRQPHVINGQEVYVPDYAIGRLPEGADEIVSFIDTFLAQGQIQLQNVLVTGYDFVIDAGQAISHTIATDLGPGGMVNGTLMSDWWQASALNGLQLGASPRFGVQFINGHASHHLQGAPLGGGVADTDIANSTTADFIRSLVVTLGCHSGLNDVGGLPAGLDLTQAFFKRGANYVANTGYGWGSNAGLGWSERLINNYVSALTQGASTTIGKALMRSKQRYFSESSAFDAYDEKAMQEWTLYGLPHYLLVSGGLLGPDDPFPSVKITTTLPLDAGPVRIGGLSFSLNGSFGALDPHQTTDGTFYGINQGVQVVAGRPVQPQFTANVTAPGTGRVHGIILNSARYSETATLNPLVSQPVNEWVPPEQWAEPPVTRDGWQPGRPLALQNLTTPRGAADTLLTQLGQFHGETGAARLYDSMDLALLYSDSPDWTPPQIAYVGERIEAASRVATVKVEAHDLSGILGGKVTYTIGDGQWRSVDLAYDAALAKWTAGIPASPATRYFVQMIDMAGNVAIADNKGRYYDTPSQFRPQFLPLIRR